jgi:DNA-binding MarR family transcriptional regulator
MTARLPLERPLDRSLPDAAEDAWALLDEAGLSREIGFVVRMAQLALFGDLFARLRGLKLTLSQLTALRLIKARPALTQQRIGDALRIKKTNLVALIDKLEERGFVYRASSETDGRAYALYLTAKGERSLWKAMQAIAAHMKTVSRFLDEDEQDRVIKSLRKVALHLPRAHQKSE